MLLPRSPAALLGSLAAVLNGLARVAIVPLFVTPLFDQVLQAQDTSALPRVLAVAALVAIGGSLALWAQDALMGRAAAELSAQWRSRLYKTLMDGPPGRLPGTSGGLASRIINDLREVETFFRFGLGTLIAESVTLLLILVLLVRADPRAALTLVALALPTVLVLRWVGGYLQRAADRSMAQSEEVGRHLQEGLRHQELVRAFGARAFMLRRFEPANQAVQRAMTQRSLIAGLQVPLTQVLVFTAIGVLVVFLVAGVERGALTVGEVISFITLVALASTPTQLLPHGYALMRQAAAAEERLTALAGQASPAGAAKGASDQSGTAGAPPLPAAAAGAHTAGPVTFASLPAAAARTGAVKLANGGPPLVELERVAYSYRPGEPVLKDVSLTLPATGLVVVSGPSGSGKTTLLRLLLRFDEPAAGRLLLAGTPLSALNEVELRRRLAYVPQDHGIISGRLRDVLAMGRGASDEELWEALEAVGLKPVVRALAGGLDAELGEDGGGLSGGQRQRLAIARALLGSPQAILLDEPTSNLDDASEHEIVTLLERLAQHRLVLAVTHRPALALAADSLLEATPAGR
jgi:ATP-binding cassette subfamily B protein